MSKQAGTARATAWLCLKPSVPQCSRTDLPLAFALRSERKNHGTRTMPDSAKATSPGVLQLPYNGQC